MPYLEVMKPIILHTKTQSCPLCLNTETKPYYHHINSKNKPRTFYFCPECQGVFRDSAQFLSSAREKSRYEDHKNDLQDVRYLNYLQESLGIFKNHIPPQTIGLDFGCGPSKGFEFLSQKENFRIYSWDKYFYPDFPLDPQTKFDFIICQEVVEHFTEPKKEFELLFKMLKDNGQIFIRTEAYPENPNEFVKWYYKDDPTHVFFYNTDVFKNLGQKMQFQVSFLDRNKWRLQRVNLRDAAIS